MSVHYNNKSHDIYSRSTARFRFLCSIADTQYSLSVPVTVQAPEPRMLQHFWGAGNLSMVYEG